MNKLKSFKIHTSDTEDDKVFLGKDLEPEIMFTEVLEILENNGYHIEIEYENTPTEKTIINNIDRPNVYFDGEKYYTILHEYYGDDEHNDIVKLGYENDEGHSVKREMEYIKKLEKENKIEFIN